LAIEHRRGIFRQGARLAKGSQAGPLMDANQQASCLSVQAAMVIGQKKLDQKRV
jgi:hypothetical protein